MKNNENYTFDFSFAVAVVIASLAGPQWLLTEEKLPNQNYNGTANFNAVDDGIYITKHTKSSLWILCASQGKHYITYRIYIYIYCKCIFSPIKCKKMYCKINLSSLT